MKTWQIILIPTLVIALICGVYLFAVFKSRQDPGVIAHKGEEAKPLTQDELSYVKDNFYTTFDQAKQLEGTTVWVKAGYALSYFPYASSVEWTKPQGELPSAEKLQIKKLVKAAAPAKVDDRIEHGSRQYLIEFTMADKPGAFAAPFGYMQGEQEGIYADQLFYYDDPKTIYSHWPQSVWDAVAAHTPKIGMTENQTRMAVGILIESGSRSIGDRTVTYHAGSKTWTVTFRNNVATDVKEG